MARRTADRRVRDIMVAERHIEEEAIDATILFADLTGSTHFKATRGLTDGIKRTLIHNETLSAAIAKHNGTVIKFVGDEVMAIFGSPDAGLDAAIAANRVFESLRMNPPIETKVGVHKGKVSYFRYPTTPVLDPQGTAVDIAARITATARPRQVLFSQDVRASASKRLISAAQADLRLKGVPFPVTVHALQFPGSEMIIDRPAYVAYLDDTARGFLDEAKRALSEKDFANAFKLANRVLRADPIHPEASYIAGAAAATGIIKEIDAGVESLERVLANDPSHYRAMNMLGYLLWRKYERTGEAEAIQRAVALAADCLKLTRTAENVDAFVEYQAQGNLAYYLAVMGGSENLEQAVRYCEAVDAFFSNMSVVRYARFLDTYGFVLMKAGQSEKARAKLDAALRLDPDNEYVHEHIAELLKAKRGRV